MNLLFWVPWTFPGDSDSKDSVVFARDPGLVPRSERSPGEGIAAYSSTLAWRIPCTEELCRLQVQRIGHDWATNTSFSPHWVTQSWSLIIYDFRVWARQWNQITWVQILALLFPVCILKSQVYRSWGAVLLFISNFIALHVSILVAYMLTDFLMFLCGQVHHQFL